MKSKKIVHLVFLIITTAPIIGGLVYVWKAQQTSNKQPATQIENEVSEKEDGIKYTNTPYGFSLMFPESWKGFVATNRSLEWNTIGISDSIDFGFPVQDSLFNISIFTKDQWQMLQAEEGPKPTFISENTTHVFAYERAQYAENDAMIERMKEVPAIIATFKITP